MTNLRVWLVMEILVGMMGRDEACDVMNQWS